MTQAYTSHPDGWMELKPDAPFLEFAKRDIAHATEMLGRYAAVYDHDHWMRTVERWQSLDTRLAAKGVTLIFVRYPSSGEYLKAEDEQFPDHLYWNTLVERFPGRCWHFRDNPRFVGLNMPDGSHMVSEDALAFSRWMAERIKPLIERP